MKQDRISHKKFVKIRKQFFLVHQEPDFFVDTKSSPILISVPHAVKQTRLGKQKNEEIGTLSTGIILADRLNSSLIIKTRNNFDDANFDKESNYKDKIKYLISAVGIKYIIDIHGLKRERDCDINLGINFGTNIKNDVNLYDKILSGLKNAGFVTTIDNPFRAGERTISGYFSTYYNVWTIQIEINSRITNDSKYISKLNELLDILISAFKTIK